jgi:L-threonylcarbamoyladenylate synthase
MTAIVKLCPAAYDDSSVNEVVDCLRDGGIIIYPTETFYGIGGLFSNEHTLNRLFKIKQRDVNKPVLILIPDISFIKKISPVISPELEMLARHFWPGPLTLLMQASPHLCPLITGPKHTVGVRISSNPLVQCLLRLLQDGITSTSANCAGGISPTSLEEIPDELLHAVDMVIDGGKTPGRSPSTILDISKTPFTINREGAVSSKQIREVLKTLGLHRKMI